mmetsp:Transcript_98973/g.175371  ORF Transcript_98973/g.175371 Transcript_98973/m.175371 type:complete len:94 (-) Transcript_98973:41-322(-)
MKMATRQMLTCDLYQEYPHVSVPAEVKFAEWPSAEVSQAPAEAKSAEEPSAQVNQAPAEAKKCCSENTPWASEELQRHWRADQQELAQQHRHS